MPFSVYDWLILAHQTTHHENETRHSLSLKCCSKTQIVMWHSLIPRPTIKCQCSCSRFYDLAGYEAQRIFGNRKLVRRKTEASSLGTPTTGTDCELTKLQKQVRQKQEVSTISATNSEVGGVAAGTLTRLAAYYTLRIFTSQSIHVNPCWRLHLFLNK